ncbi:hypothetical protein VB264_15185 [Arcicella aquatica]|uniref:Uncharacterized protein n=1 Tax=Arcicella aquatica TaxID=217141 RepID=A0ABU5QQN7_9BACT|nr:hypothetical protein [Arcicella aquatica]MEA5259139.1 hypothetical protein [Arcicella aquatica]
MYKYHIYLEDYRLEEYNKFFNKLFHYFFSDVTTILVIGWRENDFFLEKERFELIEEKFFKLINQNEISVFYNDRKPVLYAGLMDIQDMDILTPWEYFETLSFVRLKRGMNIDVEFLRKLTDAYFSSSRDRLLRVISETIFSKGDDDQHIVIELQKKWTIEEQEFLGSDISRIERIFE